ncbi:hypothetical protein BP00DRAFT_24477 [Aspergillus indologenus CBS 114.80]|uniref:Uncharacterized protein n=1 Tax=Aspergillus indologenus CBS 114.80 TaxID=1450541 RepID=A0A2V5IDF1_9EURO|nr:hypothetical protein BP00DRAFT_24477 [Aspergillus indologenus CBS 114.80]
MRDNSTGHQIESSGGRSRSEVHGTEDSTVGTIKSTTAVAQWQCEKTRRDETRPRQPCLQACSLPGLEFLQDATAGRGLREELESSIVIGILWILRLILVARGRR